MDTLESAFDATRALVFGGGGGGDVVGAVPTARLLERHGVDVLLGGVPWERFVVDPTVGPRSFDEVTSLDRINDTVALATGETRTRDGVEFAETRVARHYDEDVALVDVSGGAAGLAAGLSDACRRLDVDLVVATDSGGDVLAAGDEDGLRSPLVDAVVLAALTDLDADACLGVFGHGSDGELTPAEVDDGVARAARRDGFLGAWGLTPTVVAELDDLLAEVTTEASRLPVEAARGARGETAIRDGERTVSLSPSSAVTFYLDPAAVAATSGIASHVQGTESLDAAHEALSRAGYETELDYERRRRRES
ncbi:MAG: DUF1152 domain-containing protein [Haloferacaceae archaeon]